MDAPETEKRNRKTRRVSKPGQPYGEALLALKGKVGGQRVRVEVLDIDRYRRAATAQKLDSLPSSTTALVTGCGHLFPPAEDH